MLSRWIGLVTLSVCAALLVQTAWAEDAPAEIEQLEAGMIYDSACRLMADGEYERALTRFEHVREAYPRTEHATLAQEKIGEVATLRLRPTPINGMSRASLVTFGTLFSTWLGLGTLIIVEPDEPAAAGAVLIAGPLIGLSASLDATKNSTLSDGQASLINMGGAWGIWQATGAAAVADVDGKVAVGASMVGGVTGLALTSVLVRGRNISPGDATLINFGGIWGTWLAICGSMVADVDDEDTVLITAMAGGDTGLLTMAALAPRWGMSRARARLINISGIVGTLYGLGTTILFDVESDRNTWGILGAGSVLGLLAGTHLTRNYDAEERYFAASGARRSVPNEQASRRLCPTPEIGSRTGEQQARMCRGPELSLPLVRVKF